MPSVDTMGSPAANGRRFAFQLSSSLVFAGYFVLLLLLALAVSWLQGSFDWTTPLAQLNAKWGLGDPVSFEMGARDVARTGWITEPNRWLVRLWPPGFMVLEGSLMRLLGEDGPVLLGLLVASALLCALWMTLLRAWLLEATRPALATVAPLLPFAFPLLPFFLLTPIGLAFGECFALSLFLAGFLLALLAFRRGSLPVAALAGVCIAGAAYFRSQFELLVQFLTLGGAFVAAVAALAWLVRRRVLVPRWMLAVGGMVLLAAHGTMAPWRYQNLLDTGEAGWVYTSGLVFANALRPESEVVKAGGAFVVEGGGALACKLEPSFCGQKDAAYFYTAFLRHMPEWIADKWSRFPAYWVAPPRAEALHSLRGGPSAPEIATNLLLLACVLAGLAQLWRLRRTPLFVAHAWLQLSLYGCLAAVYTLVHFEARYLYLPKIFGVVALLALLGPREVERSAQARWRGGWRALSGAFARLSPAQAFVLYFLALLLLAQLGLSKDVGTDWTTPLQAFTAAGNLGDAVQFAGAAADVARTGWIGAKNAWVAAAWPPGPLLLAGGLMRILGEKGPVLLALLLLALAACASWMTLLRGYLLEARGPIASTLAPLLPFAFPLTPFFLLSPLGLSLGEGFGFSFFLAGFVLVLLAFRHASLARAAMAGLLLGAAAYFGAQFAVVVVVLTQAAALLLAGAAIAFVARRKVLLSRDLVRVMLVTLLLAHVAMAPWRLHNLATLGSGRWVQTSVVANGLRPEGELVAAGARYVVAGGGALACRLEPASCGKTQASDFFRAFWRHAPAWLAAKARLLPAYWMAPPHSAYLTETGQATPLEDTINLLLLACLVGALVQLWRRRRDPVFLPQAWLQLSVLACLGAAYTLAHLEARAMYLPKIFAVVALVSLFGPRTPAPARDRPQAP